MLFTISTIIPVHTIAHAIITGTGIQTGNCITWDFDFTKLSLKTLWAKTLSIHTAPSILTRIILASIFFTPKKCEG